MPKVMVGESVCNVSWQEYFCAKLPKDTPVKFEKKDGTNGNGCLSYSFYYEGVIACIEVGSNSIVNVFPALGDKIRRIKDQSQLPFLAENI